MLKRGLEGSLERLGLERIDLWQPHRIDSAVDRKAQFEVLKWAQEQGLVRHVGLSEVDVEDIEDASDYVPIATVQNRYGPTDRNSDDVLDYCTEHSIGFIRGRRSARAGWRAPTRCSRRWRSATTPPPARSPSPGRCSARRVVLMIPGTSKVAHVEENTAAAALKLSAADIAELDRLG